MRRVAFRCDANRKIGSGHFMRSLKLAKHLKEKGCFVTFIMTTVNEFIATKLEELQIDFEVFNESNHSIEMSDFLTWLPLGVDEDCRKTKKILQKQAIDILVIDHYGIDVTWEEQIAALGLRIVVVDDLADRDHHCDLLVDSNEYLDKENRYNGRLLPSCDKFFGAKFAFLDEEILKIRAGKPTLKFRKIFVCFGGADPTGETIKFLRALQIFSEKYEADFSNFSFEIVVGPFNDAVEKIRLLADIIPSAILHVDPINIYTLMSGSYFAYGAGGTMTWERAALHVPMALCSVADNQIKVTGDAAKLGYINYLGDAGNLTYIDYLNSLKMLSKKGEAYMAPNFEKLWQICDGRGVERVAEWILN